MSQESKDIKVTSIHLYYAESDAKTEHMRELARELKSRGYEVSLKKSSSHAAIKDLTKTAKEIAESAKEMAQYGMQKIRDTIYSKAAPQEDGFDEIGQSGKSDIPAPNEAAVLTDVDYTTGLHPMTFRIGLMPQTALNKTWLPNGLDAMVIPHDSFVPYLHQVLWNPDQIFVGGYLTDETAKRSDTKENLKQKFKINADSGPVVLIMANTFTNDQLPTLFTQLALCKLPYQPIFYHGAIPSISSQLRSLADRFKIHARMFGNVNALGDYFSISDLAIVNLSNDEMAINSDLATLEALAIPTLHVVNNRQLALPTFLKHNGAAIQTENLYQLSKSLVALLENKDSLKPLQEAADLIATFGSTKLCADAIEEALKTKDRILDDPDRKKQALLPNDGFELIGGTPNALGPKVTEESKTRETPSQETPKDTTPPAETTAPNAETAPLLQPVIAPTEPASAILSPTLTPRSQESVHAELTQLILLEKSIDKQLDAASDDVRKWELRLDLAKTKEDAELQSRAQVALEQAKAQEIALFKQKDDISEKKEQIKKIGHRTPKQSEDASPYLGALLDTPEVDDTERKFQELQRQQQLQMLRDKMQRGY